MLIIAYYLNQNDESPIEHSVEWANRHRTYEFYRLYEGRLLEEVEIEK